VSLVSVRVLLLTLMPMLMRTVLVLLLPTLMLNLTAFHSTLSVGINHQKGSL